MANQTITLDLTIATLRISARNARKAGPGDLAELAASIASIGLIHPLKVLALSEPDGKVTHEVIAGGRRLAAIRQAIKAKALPKSFAIRCEVVAEADAAEISLAENCVRTQMHVADQLLAYKGLIDQGLSVAAVAAKFGVSENLVTRRMKLGRVSPLILEAFRADELDLETVAAYALTDDTERQERLFRENPKARAWQVKDWLLEGQVPVSDRRVRLVGLDAYRAAGGAVTMDLLSDLEDSATIADVELLDRLVAAKLEEHRQAAASEGWKWTEVALSGFEHGQFPERVYPHPIPQSEDDKAELERLSARYDELSERFEADPENAALEAELDKANAAIDAIKERTRGYNPEDMARAGAVVMIGWDGQPRIERGCVRKEDAKARKPADTGEGRGAPGDGGDAEAGPRLPESLVTELSAVRTGILAATLMDNQHVALASVVHALASDLISPYGMGGALGIRCTDTRSEGGVTDPGCSDAFAAVEAARERWGDILPADGAALFEWCLEQDDSLLLHLLALCAALTVNARVAKGDHASGHRLRAADALAEALDVDYGAWTSVARLGLFERASKAYTLSVVAAESGASRADALRGLKKGPLAEAAAKGLDGKWLPEPIRRIARDGAAQPMAEAAE